MAISQWPNLVLSGIGLEQNGLSYNPDPGYFPLTFNVVDGLGLETNGLVWNGNNNWAACFQAQNIPWSGCSTCPNSCG